MERKLLTLIAIAALAACTPPAGETPAPEDTTTQAPATTTGAPSESDPPAETLASEPTPSAPSEGGTASAPPASPITLPACNALLTDADMELYFGESVEYAELLSPIASWGPPAAHAADLGFRQYLQRATEIESCTWGIPGSDAFFTILLATVTPELAAEVDAALAASEFPDTPPALGAWVFEDPDAVAMGVHRLEDTLWLVFQGGPGSISADHAQRLAFADVLKRISNDILH